MDKHKANVHIGLQPCQSVASFGGATSGRAGETVRMKLDKDATARPSGPDATRAQGAQPHSNPIVAALHEMAASVLSEQLREMFEKADDILFDSAEKARNGSEQQLYYDTMRTVRIQRAKIM